MGRLNWERQGQRVEQSPVAAMVEDAGLTVVGRRRAEDAGIPFVGGFGRIMLQVDSSLEAVGG